MCNDKRNAVNRYGVSILTLITVITFSYYPDKLIRI